ncbi:MAG: hypothetical protein M0C28_40565 [Candidatus Moduliflexus flocculans]|nr:hypothetical protein [Candidatus Moduliflexus flocculans]
MTSRELVVDSLEFRSPARVPRQLWTLPWAERTWPAELAAIRERFPDDIVTRPAFLREPAEDAGPGVRARRSSSTSGAAASRTGRPASSARSRSRSSTSWADVDPIRVPRRRG